MLAQAARITVDHGFRYFILLPAAGGSAIAKMAQKAAGYQDKPKGDQSCANCTLFKAPDSCTLVDGTIVSSGWCRFYAKKS